MNHMTQIPFGTQIIWTTNKTHAIRFKCLYCKKLSNCRRIFSSRGYGSISVQVGNGDVELISGTLEGIKVSCFRFRPSIADEIRNADLVISHAGAGTCLEVLNAQKPLIAVVNSDLMDDHQVELAKRLSDDGHIIFCKGPENLVEVFQKSDFTTLHPFPPGQPQKFAEFLDNFMGFKVSSR